MKNFFSTLFILVFALAIGGSAFSVLVLAEEPTMVYDIYPGPGNSVPANMAVFQGKLYFRAADGYSEPGAHGIELWVYDGANPPFMVADINTVWDDDLGEIGSSSPGYLTVFNNKLYFSAYDGVNGKELWEYDGIQPPVMVADSWPGSWGSNPADLVVFQDKLYFHAQDAPHGEELWVYDGINPPSLAADINPGIYSSSPRFMKVFNNKLYFKATDGIHGSELWEYDGVNPPTMAAEICPGSNSSSPANFTLFNDRLNFTANDGVHGYELWEYDGVNPPYMVYDLCPGSQSSNMADLTVFNGKLYFNARDSWSLSGTGNELWVYDGINPPVMVTDIYPGSGNSFPESLCVFKGKLFFSAEDGLHGREMWEYDGENPPMMTADVLPGSMGSYPGSLTVFSDKLYFRADDGTHGLELWVYDFENANILLQSPAGGDIWETCHTYTILWDSIGSQDENVKIELKQGDTLIAEISPLTPNQGSFSWTVPEELLPASDYRIVITTLDGQVSGESDLFTIAESAAPCITVTSPQTGSTWQIGNTYTISWEKCGSQHHRVKIDLMRNGSTIRKISPSTLNSGNFSWTVPAGLEPGDNYVIRVYSVNKKVSGESGTFTILE